MDPTVLIDWYFRPNVEWAVVTLDWYGAPGDYTRQEFSFGGTSPVAAATALVVGGLTLLYLVAYAAVHGPQFAQPSPVLVMGAVVLLVLVHEGVHVVVLRSFGYDVEVGVRFRGSGAAYVAPYEQPLVRWHALVAMTAPLVGLSVGLLGAVLVGSNVAATFAVFLLWANTVASASDVAKSLAMLGSPRGTLYYATADRVVAYTPPTDRG